MPTAVDGSVHTQCGPWHSSNEDTHISRDPRGLGSMNGPTGARAPLSDVGVIVVK